MIAARLFNERENTPTPVVFGCVTNAYDGPTFRGLFLKLEGNQLFTDTDRYFLDVLNLPRLLGVLGQIVGFYRGSQ